MDCESCPYRLEAADGPARLKNWCVRRPWLYRPEPGERCPLRQILTGLRAPELVQADDLEPADDLGPDDLEPVEDMPGQLDLFPPLTIRER